jgi:hypothetical protein
MIDHFMTRTGGRLPMSFSDAQSPLNVSTLIVETSGVMMDILVDPDSVRAFLDVLAGLTVDFVSEQQKIIGDCLVSPGHGFASARNFAGYGQSDDNIVMLSNDDYLACAVPSFEKAGRAFGGPVLHSCGDWSGKLPAIRQIRGLLAVDAAFSPETDPCPNPPEAFAEALAGSGIVLNARIVGSAELVHQTVQQLWRPGMKLIVVTYCSPPDEQARAYDAIH